MRNIFLAAVFIFLSISIIICDVNNLQAEEAARIISLEGKVEIQRQGSGAWLPAKENMVVMDADNIKVYKGSGAELTIDSSFKNIVRLEPDTEISIKDIRAKKIYMDKGAIFALIESLEPGSSFEVRTPTAVAGVAGSGMSVNTNGKKSDVKCFEDKAYAKGINQDGSFTAQTDVNQGYKRVIEKFMAPGVQSILTKAEKQQWESFRQQLREHIRDFRNKQNGSKGSGDIEKKEKLIENTQERILDRASDAKENIFEMREHDKRNDATSQESSGRSNDGDGLTKS